MTEIVPAFKGFDNSMKCRGFQFAEGETYEHPGRVEVCRSGFHAVTMPLDVLRYYPPNNSVYHLVELTDVDGPRTEDGDSKVAGRTIKIGAKLDLTGLIKAQVEFVFKNSKKVSGASSKKDHAQVGTDLENGAATASGHSGAATASGDYGAATASGHKTVALASGRDGKARGALGTAVFLAERNADWTIIAAEAVIVDGDQIKPNTWYTLRAGKVVEA